MSATKLAAVQDVTRAKAPVVETDEQRIEKLRKEIIEHIQEGSLQNRREKKAREAKLSAYLLAGKKLLEQKPLFKHGSWEKNLKLAFPLHYRTAQKCKALAEWAALQSKLPRAADLAKEWSRINGKQKQGNGVVQKGGDVQSDGGDQPEGTVQPGGASESKRPGKSGTKAVSAKSSGGASKPEKKPVTDGTRDVPPFGLQEQEIADELDEAFGYLKTIWANEEGTADNTAVSITAVLKVYRTERAKDNVRVAYKEGTPCK